MCVLYDFNINLFLLLVPYKDMLYFSFLPLATQCMLNKEHIISFQDEENLAARGFN